MSRTPAITTPAVLSAIVTLACRPTDDSASPTLARLRALIERGRHFTWCDPESGWIEPDAHRTYKAAAADLNNVTGDPPFSHVHPDDAANFACYRVVDLRGCLPLIVAGDAPGAVRCGPGAGPGGGGDWPAGWLVPDPGDPLSFRLRRDFPEPAPVVPPEANPLVRDGILSAEDVAAARKLPTLEERMRFLERATGGRK